MVEVLTLSSGLDTVGGSTALGAPKFGLSRRVVVLSEIAERYAELVDPLCGPSGVAGDGGSVMLMPATYTATVKRFEELVRRLRDEDRELWRHLDGWWLSASSRTVWHCPRCGLCHQPEHVHRKRNGHGLLTVKCKRVRVWNRLPGAREGEARRAIVRLAEWWPDSVGEPMIPEELRVAA